MTENLSLNTIGSRITHLMREKEKERAQERRRNIHYLILEFLWEHGYTNTADTFFKEAKLSRNFQVCDNIDLENIVLEYSDYYYEKYSKYPKLCKKTEQPSIPTVVGTKKEKLLKGDKRTDDENIVKNKTNQKVSIQSNVAPVYDLNNSMTVVPLNHCGSGDRISSKSVAEDFIFHNEKIFKPIDELYPPRSEWREIADVISREILLKDLNTHWDDVKGLLFPKKLLKEATVYPLKYPSLFNGKFNSWKGILLYGPPGTGKTMLAKAVATESKATFFNITSSSIISKWRGDSEKYVRVLMDLAVYYSPTIIFIDEIDWITTNNGDSSSNNEPSRRFRAEFLARLDGLLSMQEATVILLATTNMPWNIDVALLRRLERRIFIDLPDDYTRMAILKFYVNKDLYHTNQFLDVIEMTKNYSCADLKILCKEAWMCQLRPICESLENNKLSLSDIRNENSINNVTYLTDALKYIKPIGNVFVKEYEQWNKDFGLYKMT
ncbi:katanin p60 ATPase-containing subunit A-like 2 [Prorops nasuta]|uniref:katanin p60 ATPase-containing subunit A-like 2 n=1 Tax=Prorops nasuta TaxID=863751 RepID=UPI0034CE534C